MMVNFAKTGIICLLLIVVTFPLQSFNKEAKSALGNTIPDFRLRNIDNTMVSLAGYKNARGFIVVFTCNRCPFAKLYTDRLNKLAARYKPQNVYLLAINSMDTLLLENESFEKMQQRATQEKFNFPYLHDPLQTEAKIFGADHTPQAYVVWKENNSWKIEYTGAIDDNGAEPTKVTSRYLANAVNDLLQGKKPSKPETRSVGCTITYRK